MYFFNKNRKVDDPKLALSKKQEILNELEKLKDAKIKRNLTRINNEEYWMRDKKKILNEY